MYSQNVIFILLILKLILFRYPLTILYVWIFCIIVKNRKRHFSHPFYVIVISLALSNFLINAANEFYSIRQLTLSLAETTSFMYGSISFYIWTPMAVASPGLELFMSLMRFIAIVFPMHRLSIKVAIVFAIVPWIYGYIIGILYTVPGFGSVVVIENGTERYDNGQYADRLNDAYLYSTVFLSIASFGICCLAAILLFRQKLKLSSGNSATLSNLNKEMKMLIQATLVTSLSATTHLYAYIITAGYTIAYNPPHWQWHLKFFLYDCIGLVNPIIYLVFNQKLRTLFLSSIPIVRKAFRASPSSDSVYTTHHAQSEG